MFVNLLFLWRFELTFSLAQRKSNKKKHGADVVRRLARNSNFYVRKKGYGNSNMVNRSSGTSAPFFIYKQPLIAKLGDA